MARRLQGQVLYWREIRSPRTVEEVYEPRLDSGHREATALKGRAFGSDRAEARRWSGRRGRG